MTLTVSGGELGDSESQDVAVTEPPADGITLSATGYKVRGRKHADLEWSGATSTNVDILRGGAVVATTANDGAYTDATDSRGGGSFTYQVCEAGTSTCSNVVAVTF